MQPATEHQQSATPKHFAPRVTRQQVQKGLKLLHPGFVYQGHRCTTYYSRPPDCQQHSFVGDILCGRGPMDGQLPRRVCHWLVAWQKTLSRPWIYLAKVPSVAHAGTRASASLIGDQTPLGAGSGRVSPGQGERVVDGWMRWGSWKTWAGVALGSDTVAFLARCRSYTVHCTAVASTGRAEAARDGRTGQGKLARVVGAAMAAWARCWGLRERGATREARLGATRETCCSRPRLLGTETVRAVYGLLLCMYICMYVCALCSRHGTASTACKPATRLGLAKQATGNVHQET